MSEDVRPTLRTFLKDRRARLTPGDVGLPSYGRRRCRGLRREEVAELAGVSAHWYTLFEVARRNRRASIQMIERVAVALRLSDEDYAMLLCLAVPELARASSYITRGALEAQRVDEGASRALGEHRAPTPATAPPCLRFDVAPLRSADQRIDARHAKTRTSMAGSRRKSDARTSVLEERDGSLVVAV